MPPALAKDLAYSSLRNERHTPAPPPPPNGPSPSMAVNIWPNIEARNEASKSIAWARALALGSEAGPATVREGAGLPLDAVSRESDAEAVCPARDGIVDISHHL